MLGSDFDLALGLAPVDLSTAGGTGLRQYMGNLDYLTVVFVGAASAASEAPVLTLKQHTASTGGTTADMVTVTEFWRKSETTLDNDEVWAKVTQAASATVTGQVQVQQMIAFVVRPDDLSAGNAYVSVNIADNMVVAQPGTLLYILSGVSPRGVPESMPVPLR